MTRTPFQDALTHVLTGKPRGGDLGHPARNTHAVKAKPPGAPCKDCGTPGPVYPHPLGAGWYRSPWCDECMDSDLHTARRRTSEDGPASTLVARAVNSGLSVAEAEDGERFPLLHQLEQLSQERPWAYLVGNVGTGKTTQAAGAILHALKSGRTARYVTEGGLIALLMPSHQRHEPQHAFIAPDLLVIDEFLTDARPEKRWQGDQLRAVLNERYRRRKDTVLVSNHSLAAVAAKDGMGDLIMTRIVERCGGMEQIEAGTGGYVEFTWSYRVGAPMPLPSGCFGLGACQVGREAA